MRRKRRLSDEILSEQVTLDTLVDAGLNKVFDELNTDSCLNRNWRGLAARLVEPPLTNNDVEILADFGNPARALLERWVSQDKDGHKTFGILIASMLECKVYSACDELLIFLEECEHEFRDKELENSFQLVVADSSDETLEFENNSSQFVANEQQRAADTNSRLNSKQLRKAKNEFQRSASCPASWFSRFFKRRKRFKRSKSFPASPEIECITPKPVEDEIFVVSSNTDSQSKAMRDIMSFMNRLKPVCKGSLTVKTIHDVDQNGMMTTSWLEERVNRARFVVLCFSSIMKAIVDHKPGMPQFENQMEFNLKFTMDFLVTGKIYENICRNPKGKYIPLILPGHDYSTLIVPLKYFLSFNWPSEEKKISNYILGTPEYPVPQIPPPKPLVRKEFC